MGLSSQTIRKYLQNLDPKILGLREIKSITIRKLGIGESNLNYLATVGREKFIVRIGMDPKSTCKTRREYDSLKIVEPLGIAPKGFHFEPSRGYMEEAFIILEYLEGTSLDKNKEIDDHVITMLARLVANLHNTNIEKITQHLQKHKSSKTDILHGIERRINYIKTKRKIYFDQKGTFECILTVSYEKLQKFKFGQEPLYVLGHGDVAPQNVILFEDRLKLVDWEDLGLIDPALEVAIIFDSFDFSERQKRLFLKEYETMRRDIRLRKRISLYWPFQLFNVFCWSVMHVYEIGEREMHKEFLKEQDLRGHISYAQKMFSKCKKAGIIDKNAVWNPSEVFPKKYLKASLRKTGGFKQTLYNANF